MQKMMVSFTPQQLAWLQQEADRLGIKRAELIRRIIDAARKA